MSVAHQFRDGMKSRINILFQNTIVRYLFAIAAVASVFALRIWLIPLTGTGAPYVLFFAAVLVTSVFAGVGPAICAVLLSMPLGASFVVGAGYSFGQASFQSLLFAIDGIVVIYLTSLAKKGVRSLQSANRQVRESEERYRALFYSIDEGFCVIEVLFDHADNPVDYRFLEVNQVFEKQTGISNAVGRRMREIAPAHEEHWFQIYGQIALTGESRRFESPALALGRFYNVYAFRVGRPEQRQVAILFDDITQRKRIEEALHESEERLELAMEAGGIGTFDWNIRTNEVVWTEQPKAVFARPSGAFRGVYDDFSRRVLPKDLLDLEARIQEAFRKNQHDWHAEYRMMSSDTAEERWINSQGHIFYDAQGEPQRMIGVYIDITVRKRIEEELKAANTFLDAIIENIPLMLFIKESKSLRFIRLNRAGEDLLGWPKETLIAKNAYDFWPKEQAEFFIEKDHETLNSGRVVDIPEEPIQTRYQGVRILHTKKVPILDTAGNPVYLLGISEDITERKRIEKQQQFLDEVSVALSTSIEYEQTLANLVRLVVQNFADWSAVDVMDEEGQLSRLKVASANPAQAALCAALEHLPPDRDLPHLARSVIESKRPIVVEKVTPEYVESLGLTPGHQQAVLAMGVTSFVAVPLLMRGQPLGALFLGSSTESRVFGQGDLRLAEALADRAAMAIENARLYRSAVYAAQLRDQVLGVVAHDLRNPLSTILLYTSAMKRQVPDPERRFLKPMEVIHQAATRMNRLIQDLLDVALMEAGQLTIERGRVSAGRLVNEAVDMQRRLASSSSLELRVEVDPDVPESWGDRDRLLQVFENLIGNAIKFTQAGGRITAGATSRDNEVVFWVADTGCGIPSENLPRVFDRFWQATRTARQGAGLGLPITRGIVEAHGGRIWVESTAGSGSTFFFTIPRASAAEESRPGRAA